MASWTKQVRIRGLVLLAAVVVAACGDGNGNGNDNGDGVTPTVSPTPNASATATPVPPTCATDVVQTTSGPVCGLVADVVDLPGTTTDAYYGIPYGETTAGENRWRAPIPSPRGWPQHDQWR